jgi:hypothetical protein
MHMQLDKIEGTVERVKLDRLKATAKMQTREALNKEALEDYKRIAKEAEVKGADPDFGPLVAYRDSFGGEQGDLYLSDGFHRRMAMMSVGIKEFPVEIRVSDDAKRDALLNGFKSNIAHGVRLTSADKRHNLNLALEDKEWAKKNNVELAEMLGVSEGFIRFNRPADKKPTVVKTKAGMEVDTTNLGKKGGLTRDKKAAAKKAAKAAKLAGKKPASTDVPKADAVLDKAYAKISKALEEKGPRTVEAIKSGTIQNLSRADVIKLSMNSDNRVRELGELVFTERWSLKKAVKFLDKVIDGESKIADLINRAITGGGFYRDKVEKNTVIVVRDDWGTVGEKDGVTTITPKKKK